VFSVPSASSNGIGRSPISVSHDSEVVSRGVVSLGQQFCLLAGRASKLVHSALQAESDRHSAARWFRSRSERRPGLKGLHAFGSRQLFRGCVFFYRGLCPRFVGIIQLESLAATRHALHSPLRIVYTAIIRGNAGNRLTQSESGVF